jgi:hypothetical protein
MARQAWPDLAGMHGVARQARHGTAWQALRILLSRPSSIDMAMASGVDSVPERALVGSVSRDSSKVLKPADTLHAGFAHQFPSVVITEVHRHRPRAA